MNDESGEMRLYIPTLMYHHVSPSIHSSISVSPKLFTAQISALYEAGWEAISIHAALRFLDNGTIPSHRAFVLTFDDAYQNFFTYALPVLRDFKAPACVYVISDFVGQADTWNHRAEVLSQHLSWEQLRTLLSLGFEIGCHSRTHQCLVKLDEGWLKEEVIGAKADLERRLDVSIDLFCYPYGKFNDRVHSEVAEHFVHSVTIEDRGSLDWSKDRWAVRRIFVGPKHEPDSLERRLLTALEGKDPESTVPHDIRKLIG